MLKSIVQAHVKMESAPYWARAVHEFPETGPPEL